MEHGQHHVLQGPLEGQRQGGVVHVLRGQAEVHKLRGRASAEGVQLLLEPVLDRLDVVVRGLLGGLDGLGVVEGEVAVERAEVVWPVEDRKLGQPHLRQGDQVLDLDLHPVADQAPFRQVGRKLRSRRAVPAVHRSKGRQGIQFHGPAKVRLSPDEHAVGVCGQRERSRQIHLTTPQRIAPRPGQCRRNGP